MSSSARLAGTVAALALGWVACGSNVGEEPAVNGGATTAGSGGDAGVSCTKSCAEALAHGGPVCPGTAADVDYGSLVDCIAQECSDCPSPSSDSAACSECWEHACSAPYAMCKTGPAGSCVWEGKACFDSADCCQDPTSLACVNGVCAIPPGGSGGSGAAGASGTGGA